MVPLAISVVYSIHLLSSLLHRRGMGQLKLIDWSHELTFLSFVIYFHGG